MVAGGDSMTAPAPTEVYDPLTKTWTTTGPMANPGSGHTATLLTDGRVLVAGTSGELYDSVSGTWSNTATMIEVSYFPTATLLNDGTVLVVGGTLEGGAPAGAQVFDPT